MSEFAGVRRRCAWLVATIVAADQLSKWAARRWLSPHEPLFLLPVADWRLHYNSGAAFGILSDGHPWQSWLLLGLSAAICALALLWLMRQASAPSAFAFGLASIVGGGLGNLIDRARLGRITDFISLHWGEWYFPTFNLADMAISFGVALILWRQLRPGAPPAP